MSASPNGDCPKCGKPFPPTRKRCWSCNPNGKRSPAAKLFANANGPRHQGIACGEPSPAQVEQVEVAKAALKESIAPRQAIDRIDILKRAMAVKAEEERQEAILSRAAPKPSIAATPADPEIAAIAAIVRVLDPLDPVARRRVWAYLDARYGDTHDPGRVH